MSNRAELDALQALESQLDSRLRFAAWFVVTTGLLMTAAVLMSVDFIVQVSVCAVMIVGTLWCCVQVTRSERAWSARASVQAALEEAESVERVRRRSHLL